MYFTDMPMVLNFINNNSYLPTAELSVHIKGILFDTWKVPKIIWNNEVIYYQVIYIFTHFIEEKDWLKSARSVY